MRLKTHPSVKKSQYFYEVITENKNDHVEPQLEAQLSFFGIEMQSYSQAMQTPI